MTATATGNNNLKIQLTTIYFDFRADTGFRFKH